MTPRSHRREAPSPAGALALREPARARGRARTPSGGTRRAILRLLAPAAAVGVAAAAIVLGSRPGDSCGPMLPRAVFVVSRHPDAPETEFVAGRLGVIRPTWYQRYLFAAYRRIRGLPLDSLPHPLPGSDDPYRAAAAWIEARARVPGVPPERPPDPYRSLDPSGGYPWFVNLHEAAFQSAIATLDERIARFGADSPEVRDWVAAQDRVFESAAGTLVRPEAAAPGAPALVRADRAYQTAAAEFYAGDFEAAAAGFDAIADDAASPWRTLGPYLVARALTRKATLSGSDEAPDTASLAVAAHQARRVLEDPRLAPVHAPARRLLDFIRFRLEPRERLRELCAALSAPRPGADLGQDLVDLTLMLDRFSQTEVESLAAASPEYDLADWILTLQSGSADAHRHALARWREAPHWTPVAIARARGTEPDAPTLITAAAAAAPGDPAYATLAYHRVRLLAESGRADEARDALDRLLAETRTPWPPSSWNLLRAARLELARTLDEFLAFTPREPVGFAYDMDFDGHAPDSAALAGRAYPGALCMDGDAAAAFRRALPLDVLARIATGSDLPDNLRAEVAFSTWVRVVLLERDDVATSLAPVVASLVPALAARLEAYASAPDEAARRFAAADLMLHTPGARPSVMVGLGRLTPLGERDEYRDNWWCAAHDADDFDRPIFSLDPFGRRPWGARADTAATAFLDAGARAAAANEAARLERLAAAPTWLAREAIAWAERHPGDPRVPEALHLAVQATRYGCPDDDTSDASRRAFTLLHRRYPESPWAKQTPYWY